MALLASFTATQINEPSRRWRALLPGRVRTFLAKIWRGALIAFVLLFFISVEIAIFGWPLTSFLDADAAFDLLNTLSYIMLGLMLLSVLTGLAYDVQQQTKKERQAYGSLVQH